MDLSREEQQRQEFREILFFLAESQETLREKSNRARIYKRLEDLYYAPQKSNRFRHFYSDIFSVLTTIKQGDKVGSIDVLGQNLYEIRKWYQAINNDAEGNLIDISNSIRKLYDHVSLDIARMGYSDAADRKLSQETDFSTLQAQVSAVKIEAEQLQKQITIVKEEASVVQGKLDSQEANLRNVQKEYIAILGIFASVVLTFTAGIAFSTSVLQNLHTASVYRIISAILLIGIVLANVLYGLFYYIDRLVNKPTHREIKPLLFTNVILIGLLALTSLGWFFGIAENRNSRIKNLHVYVDNTIVASQSPSPEVDSSAEAMLPEVGSNSEVIIAQEIPQPVK